MIESTYFEAGAQPKLLRVKNLLRNHDKIIAKRVSHEKSISDLLDNK